jgi:hydrogenase maturation protein HypF
LLSELWLLRAEIKVCGIVQGVGFRPFVYRTAVENRLTGFVRNRGDAFVEIVVEGKDANVRAFLRDLRRKKPPLARIYDVKTKFFEGNREFDRFLIQRSSGEAAFSGSVIPPDVSICEACLRELRGVKDRRHDYFFITCTDCGPRYTIIEDLPYDRPSTTMKQFRMCPFCKREYTDPANRRFHAQTVACPVCGPKAFLADSKGKVVRSKDPIREAGKLLEEGSVLAIKGYGGFHVATATTVDEPIARLRAVKHRSQKPFAIMARDLETIRSFAQVSHKEAELLTSYVKPIVLLKKSPDYFLSGLVAPGLHNVGVMLPYTGLHYMLFDGVREPAFVMTSANPPNEPIVTDNDEAVKKLGSIVDYFLFHDRLIAQRCDDSVVRVHGKDVSFIRRSRGYAPEPIRLKKAVDKCVLALGGELNSTSCVLLGDKAFISQHVGDVENLETLRFLKSASEHLLRLTNCKPDVIACDLHPRFTTTRLAREWSDELGVPLVQVQHHHAHGAALMAEHGLDEIIAVVCDGYGYGLNGEAWGGEILYCNNSREFQRVGHLEPQPMVGGDLATRYPLRMAAGILSKATSIEEWLRLNSAHLPHGEQEVNVILHQLKKGSVLLSSSCGRVLDAVSAVLGICYERTYEGEPAMRLEAAAANGKDVLKFQPEVKDNVVDTTALMRRVFERRNTDASGDLAFSTQRSLADGLAQVAVDLAERLGVDVVGFSGGVAYNEHVTKTIRRLVEENKLRFVIHKSAPAGDAGISLGQAVATSSM